MEEDNTKATRNTRPKLGCAKPEVTYVEFKRPFLVDQERTNSCVGERGKGFGREEGIVPKTTTLPQQALVWPGGRH